MLAIGWNALDIAMDLYAERDVMVQIKLKYSGIDPPKVESEDVARIALCQERTLTRLAGQVLMRDCLEELIEEEEK